MEPVSHAIEIRSLKKAFGEKQVLKNLSLSFPQGKTTVLMGPSGCGKTTLFRIIAGLEKADSGDITGLSAPVALMFQEDRLIPAYTAKQNLQLVLPKSFPEETLAKHFQQLGLDLNDPRPVNAYSGGMKRRVALLRAVLFPANTLLLDEPFKGLDASLKGTVIAYLRETLAGKTVLIITHDKEDAALLSSEIVSWPEQAEAVAEI